MIEVFIEFVVVVYLAMPSTSSASGRALTLLAALRHDEEHSVSPYLHIQLLERCEKTKSRQSSQPSI